MDKFVGPTDTNAYALRWPDCQERWKDWSPIWSILSSLDKNTSQAAIGTDNRQ